MVDTFIRHSFDQSSDRIWESVPDESRRSVDGTRRSVDGTGRGVIENKHWADVESTNQVKRVYMSINPEVRSCSDLRRVPVLNDPQARRYEH